jgi:hypothetical protein
MSYELTSDVPIPPNARGCPAKYPFKEMKVGESFVLSNDEDKRVGRAAYYYRKCHVGVAFTMRRIDAQTLRIWRTA